MKYCTKCGKFSGIKEKFNFCPYCGSTELGDGADKARASVMAKNINPITVKVDCNINPAIDKLNELIAKTKEAIALVDELDSMIKGLSFKFDF